MFAALVATEWPPPGRLGARDLAAPALGVLQLLWPTTARAAGSQTVPVASPSKAAIEPTLFQGPVAPAMWT